MGDFRNKSDLLGSKTEICGFYFFIGASATKKLSKNQEFSGRTLNVEVRCIQAT